MTGYKPSHYSGTKECTCDNRHPMQRYFVDTMAHRLELGLDIWTGKPLIGKDATDVNYLRKYKNESVS